MTDHRVSFFPFSRDERSSNRGPSSQKRRRGLVATGKREHGLVLLTYDDSSFARSSLLLAGETDRLKLGFIAKPRSEVSWASKEKVSLFACHCNIGNRRKESPGLVFCPAEAAAEAEPEPNPKQRRDVP